MKSKLRIVPIFQREAFAFIEQFHRHHKKPIGQQYLNENRIKLGGQNKKVFEYLMAGNEIDGNMTSEWNPKIRFLNSRIADLGIYGFHISNYNNHLLPGLLK